MIGTKEIVLRSLFLPSAPKLLPLSPKISSQFSVSTEISFALNRFRVYLMADRGLKPTTAATYLRMIGKLMRDNHSPTLSLTVLREYIVKLRDSEYSQSYISSFCLVIEEYTAYMGTPIRLQRGKKARPAPKETLSEGEVAVVLAFCTTDRERAVISILAYSGIRNDELCRLRPSDILMDTWQLKIRQGKGGHGRMARISGKCCSDIATYLSKHPRSSEDPLFVSLRQGKPFEGATVRRLVKRVISRTGIKKPVYPHLFRHSLAVNMLSRGASLLAIRDQLGHADIQTTMIYLRSADSRLAIQYEMYCPSYS